MLQSRRFKTSGTLLQSENDENSEGQWMPLLLLLRNYFVGPELLVLRAKFRDGD